MYDGSLGPDSPRMEEIHADGAEPHASSAGPDSCQEAYKGLPHMKSLITRFSVPC